MTASPFATENSVDNPDAPAITDNNDNNDYEGVGELDPADSSDNDKSVERTDLGNHEADEEVEPPHVNDEGYLVDADGEKVFTTVEESLKDGSMLLDEQGRQPGVYLQDLEAEARDRHGERVEKAFENAQNSDTDVVERQVNVTSSPLPPVTVHPKQEKAVDPAPAALDDTSERPASEEEVVRNS